MSEHTIGHSMHKFTLDGKSTQNDCSADAGLWSDMCTGLVAAGLLNDHLDSMGKAAHIDVSL